MVGHIWLGKVETLESRPSQLDAYCDFFSQYKSEQLIFTHLREYGRETNELWDVNHFQMIKSNLHCQFPELKVSAGLMGDQIDL